MGRIGILARHGMFASFSGTLLQSHNLVAHASIAGESGKKQLILSGYVWGSEFKHDSFTGKYCLALLYL